MNYISSICQPNGLNDIQLHVTATYLGQWLWRKFCHASGISNSLRDALQFFKTFKLLYHLAQEKGDILIIIQ